MGLAILCRQQRSSVTLGQLPTLQELENLRGQAQETHQVRHNGKFWNGLDRQLPAYMASDEVEKGWFLALRYRDGKKWNARANELPGRVREAAAAHGRTLKSTLIDARPRESASKL
jgi:hypothetical protein